jgi:hypothetical protein
LALAITESLLAFLLDTATPKAMAATTPTRSKARRPFIRPWRPDEGSSGTFPESASALAVLRSTPAPELEPEELTPISIPSMSLEYMVQDNRNDLKRFERERIDE